STGSERSNAGELSGATSIPQSAARIVTPSCVPPGTSGTTSATTDTRQSTAPPRIQPVVHRRAAATSSAEAGIDPDLYFDQPVLSADELVGQVLLRNRTAQAMVATWRAASQRYPQAVSLEDPMFNSMFAPASFASNQVQPAYILGASQKIPWRGKRPLRGEQAQAEAAGALQDVEDVKLQLAEAARLAFYDYYLVRRQLALNAENMARLVEFRDTARERYEANLARENDLLQAELELADAQRKQFELERMDGIAKARINTLLHRDPGAPLPPPPAALRAGEAPPPVEELRALALARRPDLAALAARIRAERAALALAYKDFYPDLELFARYDSFWQPDSQRDLRSQVGMNMNVPLYRDRRRAAAREAMFNLSRRRAEYEQRVDDVNQEVQAAYEQLRESRRAVELYSSLSLPRAEQNVGAARAGYEAGQEDFLRLVFAQRQFISLRDKYQEAIANYHRRRAELERVIGGPLPIEPSGEPIPPGRRLPLRRAN
ncbi:MAG TPA: TolC family protein, partial [Pirellulales bacterium]|nr:TolC family protein [Pirellulales bacterium]